ncbi:hypothetical protein GIX45_19530 [Erwinia sp. CPCC 100877]|nr:hypothetical protein [Erwinia sp. CPCC 100877]
MSGLIWPAALQLRAGPFPEPYPGGAIFFGVSDGREKGRVLTERSLPFYDAWPAGARGSS